MVDEIWEEEKQKLAETVQQIDEMITYRQNWMKKTKEEAGSGETQAKQRELYEQERENLIKAKPRPYFGRVDFTPEDKADTAETYYIGKMHIPVNHVFSWDADVAELYRNLTCNEYETKKQKRLIKGLVTLRRALSVESTHLIDYTNIYQLPAAGGKPLIVSRKESPLTKALARSKTDQMRDIVETLQPGQYEKIRAGLEQVIIVQGVAGSGKSEIGIHRLAYLLSPQREEVLKPEDVILFGPSQVFLTYISTVLPGLNVPRVRQRTVTDWLRSTLSHGPGRPARDVLQERVLKGSSRNLDKSIIAERLKGTIKMGGVLENHARILKEQYYRNISDIIVNGRIIVKKEQIKRVIRNSHKINLNELRKEISAYVIREVRKIFPATVLRAINKQIEKEISRFWPKVDFLKEYRTLISNKDILTRAAKKKLDDDDIQTLVEYGTKLGKNKLTDLPALCYLDHLLNDRLNRGTSKQRPDYFLHIVVDEAQDVSPLTLQVIKLHSKNNSFTILGDSAQHVLPYVGISDWNEIRKLFPQNTTRMMKAPFSYRPTYEITGFVREILKIADPKAPKPRAYRRHGDKVKFIRSKTQKESIQAIAEDIKGLKARGFQSLAVLCKTTREAAEIHRGLIQAGITDASLLDKQQSSASQVSVGTILISRGLEFDAVLIINAN
ncbi:UvrD-helicase domain-containing protein [Candidatus Uhrbacteria bacterium]|nr:UvrD-helicase domain-containing protein [Candidatus Uhrbacteria bacterium]